MKHTDSSLPPAAGPDWYLLGALELTVNPDADHAVGKWLTVILSPLQLHGDFMSEVLDSAEEAAKRAMQAEAVIKFQHTHLLVYVPEQRPSNGGSWGFFRIEKFEGAPHADSPGHSIEFYLYLEGRTRSLE